MSLVPPRAPRLAGAWAAGLTRAEGLLVSYLVAGDPGEHASLDLMAGIVLAGTDLAGLPSAASYLDLEEDALYTVARMKLAPHHAAPRGERP